MTAFEKARLFVYRNARPLDLARFQFHFENGSKEAVMNALLCYQNEDGGCGHAVEADCWNPNSIPLHSNTASDIVREIGWEDASHPFIQGLVRFYASGTHFNGHCWSITVPSSNNYPHAPWWHTESVSTCHTDYNGTAQIAGFLVRFAPKDSSAWQLGLRVVREAIEALAPESLNDMHTCTCYLRMLEYVEAAHAENLIEYESLKAKLHTAVNKLIIKDTSQWNGYNCKPSQFMDSCESPFYSANRELAEYECDFILNTQLADGSWDIPWSWQDFPDEWAISKNWWKSNNIILNLRYLRGFGRL